MELSFLEKAVYKEYSYLQDSLFPLSAFAQSLEIWISEALQIQFSRSKDHDL